MALRVDTSTWRAWVATLVALVLATGTAHAATLVGLTTANALIRFDSATPGTLTAGPIAITGLSPAETMVGIDYRPATAALFGLSNLNRLYTINVTTGAVTFIGTLGVSLSGTEFGLAINPVPDRIRVVSDTDQNIRVNTDTGAIAAVDSALNFAGGDPNAGANPNVTGSAYTNSFAGATTTTLYGIDSNLDILVIQSNPNGGTLNTVGPLGVNTTAVLAFDIEPPTNTAFAAMIELSSSALYTINLTTGAATQIGGIGGGVQVRGLAVVPYVSSLVGLTTANALIRFDANAPGTIVGGPTPITGLGPGETMLGIDYRPATGVLYGLSNSSRLFRLDAATGTATLVSALSGGTLTGTKFGVDFNATVDRLRVVSNNSQNIRVNPDTGAVVAVDSALAFAPGDPNAGASPFLTEVAYTNSFAGAVSTALYGIDSTLDILVNHTNPNGGVLVTIGPLGVNASFIVGFEIEPALNLGFAAMEVGGISSLYRINLTTGAATVVGAIGGGHHLIGLAAVLFGGSPSTFAATAAGAAQINVTWSAVLGADHYDVYRRAAGGSFALVASVPELQLADMSVVAGASYLYKVRAIGPTGQMAPDSSADLATAVAFTDDPLLIGTTTVRATHLTDLRNAVNAVRALAGLGAASFTNAAPAGVTVAVVHVNELRAALDPARATLGLPAAVYTRTLIAGTSIISAVDFTELRNGVK